MQYVKNYVVYKNEIYRWIDNKLDEFEIGEYSFVCADVYGFVRELTPMEILLEAVVIDGEIIPLKKIILKH